MSNHRLHGLCVGIEIMLVLVLAGCGGEGSSTDMALLRIEMVTELTDNTDDVEKIVIQYESDNTSLIEVDPCMHEQPTSIEGVSGLVWKCQDNDPIDIAGGINYRFDAQFRDERGLVLFTGEMDNVSVPPGEIRTLRMMVRPINKVGVDPAFILTENFDTTKETSGDMQIDDLVTINAGSNDISVLLGKGNGVYNSELRIIEGVGEDPVAAQVVDLNEDGYMDLAIVNISFINISERGSITVLLGQGDGTFEPAPDSPFEIGANPIAIAVEDFNKDGYLDLATANIGASGISVMLGQGNGHFVPLDMPAVPQLIPTPYALVAKDFTGDGYVDIITTNTIICNVFRGPPTFSFLKGNGDGTFTFLLVADLTPCNCIQQNLIGRDASIESTTGFFSIIVEDFNSDQYWDLAVVNPDFDNVIVFTGKKDGVFEKVCSLTPVGKFPRAITTKDLNHDTHLDLVTANAGSDDITILLGNGDGSFQSLEHIPVLTAPASIAVGHFDRDPSNHWDLAVANAGFDNVSVLLGDGQGGFISAPIK